MTAAGYRLDRLLRPRVGRGRRRHRPRGQLRRQALLNLDAIGYPGEVWGVNPSRDEVLGRPCVPIDRRSARGRRRGGGRDPRGRRARRDRAGRRPRLRRRGRVQRRLRRGRRRAWRCSASWSARRRRQRLPVCGPNCNGIVSPCTRGRRCGATRFAPAEPGRGGADLPERQRRRQRARPRAAGCGSTPWSPAATRRSCRPPTTSSCWLARTACGRSRCIWRTTAVRGCAKGWRRAPTPASRWWCSRSGARPPGREPRPRTAPRWPATSGCSAAWCERPERSGPTDVHELLELAKTLAVGRARRRRRGPRAGDHDLLGRRLGPGRRRGRAARARAARVRCRDGRATARAAARRPRPSPTRSTTPR